MGKITKIYKKKIFKVFRIFVIIIFVCGFTYQTLQFFLLYWTYPTVVDIQQSSPFYIDLPAFTFCNRIGYRFQEVINLAGSNSYSNNFFQSWYSPGICESIPKYCNNVSGTLKAADDFQTIFFLSAASAKNFDQDTLDTLALPLEDYLNCTIEFAGNVTYCNMENVRGSFYSPLSDELPQICYTIYSLWGQPNKKREQIQKGSILRFHMNLNASQRTKDEMKSSEWVGPRFQIPSDPAVQMAVHSPYFLPSPFIQGSSYIGGREYEIRISLRESHLMPLPYQTNCTDYMTTWKERGGKAPIDQLSVIQECRVNVTLEKLGCIPIKLDYPHYYNVCKNCGSKELNCHINEPKNDCVQLAHSFNEPCNSIKYTVVKENKVIVVDTKFDSSFYNEDESFRITLAQHDCEGNKVWKEECSSIKIEVPFDIFEITNLTFNAKFESLELFSVIGGYMGMWLGISLLAIFDMGKEAIDWLNLFIQKKKLKRVKKMSKVAASSKKNKNHVIHRINRMQPSSYNVW